MPIFHVKKNNIYCGEMWIYLEAEHMWVSTNAEQILSLKVGRNNILNYKEKKSIIYGEYWIEKKNKAKCCFTCKYII